MKNKEQQFNWEDLENIWANSSQTKEIHMNVSDFLNEVKDKTSHFEKDLIKRDLEVLSSSWEEVNSMISYYEKSSIKKDLNVITKQLNKFLNRFKDKD